MIRICSKCGMTKSYKKVEAAKCAYVCMGCRSIHFTPYMLPGVPTRCDVCRREFLAQDGKTVCYTCTFKGKLG